jgi:hypothetical protein
MTQETNLITNPEHIKEWKSLEKLSGELLLNPKKLHFLIQYFILNKFRYKFATYSKNPHPWDAGVYPKGNISQETMNTLIYYLPGSKLISYISPEIEKLIKDEFCEGLAPIEYSTLEETAEFISSHFNIKKLSRVQLYRLFQKLEIVPSKMYFSKENKRIRLFISPKQLNTIFNFYKKHSN